MVSEELQRYRCFGCGKSGDIFNFIMDFEGVEFSEALKLLADKAGVKLEYKSGEKDKKEKDLKQKIIEMNQIAAKFYHKLLLEHKFGEKARSYLKERGITDSTVKEFELGYAPKSWDSLSKILIKMGYTSEEINTAGLGRFRKNSKDTYDMFRGRLMFPLHDHLERVVGFAGRALEADQEPKYINTAETPIFRKEQYLYGIKFAKGEIRQQNIAIIAEGEFDMISPYQAGYKNILASKGTALTPGQSALVKRYAETAILIFDNDPAGADAAIRAIQIIQDGGLNIKIAVMPDEVKDPDELVKADPSQFKKAIKEAMPLWDYYFLYATKKFNFGDVFEKKKASEFLLKVIKNINDEVVKAGYIKKFATLFDVDESSVKIELEKVSPELISNQSVIRRDENAGNLVVTNNGLGEYPQSELYLLSLLAKVEDDKLQFYLDSIDEDIFSNAQIELLMSNLKKSFKDNKRLDIKAFYDKLSDSHPELNNLFEKIYLLDVEEDLHSPEILETEIASSLKRLKTDFLKRKLKNITKAIKQAEAASDAKEISKLQEKVKEFTRELTDLNS